MGLFDFLRKKKIEDREESETKVVTSPEEVDDSAPGWEAIDKEFLRIYPEQTNPKHYGTIVKYMFGGSAPLDGISVYDAGDFWHFVSYGLSELYKKETDDPKYSGYGFEFTFKLKKSGNDDEEEILGVCSNLQKMARYVFQSGNVIFPGDYIYTQQTTGIDRYEKSLLTGFIADSDDLVNTIETSFGEVAFITLIGATDDELKMIYESGQGRKKTREVLEKLETQITDYNRRSII